jgi:thymidine kinase
MSLSVIIGPMFSGKSTRILQLASRYASIDMPCMVIKPRIDNRYDPSLVVTHDLGTTPCLVIDRLMNILPQMLEEAQVIIVEEAQFFPDLLSFVTRQVYMEQKRVYVVGLSGDADCRSFGQILDCIPMADTVEMLKALCRRCANGNEASFTHRLAGPPDQQILIGGADRYEALCRPCYIRAGLDHLTL